jgi:hypothetical protein
VVWRPDNGAIALRRLSAILRRSNIGTADMAILRLLSQFYHHIQLPATSKVTVTCHGGGCPFATRTFSPKAKSLTLAPAFGHAKLQPRATIQITVNVANDVGRVASFAVRSGQPPTQTALCLVPGTHKPAACATS